MRIKGPLSFVYFVRRNLFVTDAVIRHHSLSLLVILIAGSIGKSAIADEICDGKLRMPRSQYRQILNNHSKLIRQSTESNQPDDWSVDGQMANSRYAYNVFFRGALGDQTFEEYSAGRKSSGKSTHILDLFGSAVFSSTPAAFDSLTGVRLLPMPEEKLPAAYSRATNWRELHGDLLTRKVWADLDRDMLSRGINKFDLIIIRPEGPLQTAEILMMRNSQNLQTYSGIFYSILEKAWEHLSDDDGQLLVQLPGTMLYEGPTSKWLKALGDQGFDWSYHDTKALRLTKHQNSAPSLPQLTADDITTSGRAR